MCALSHPFSRGSVHISSADPLAPPAIDPNYFSNPADLDILARGADFCLRLWETEELGGSVKKRVLPGDLPGRDNDEVRLEKIKEYEKEYVGPVFHPVGTAAMMKREEGGVVDPELKVYGTSNVRVADVSILPLVIIFVCYLPCSVLNFACSQELSIHILSAAYAIAEKVISFD